MRFEFGAATGSLTSANKFLEQLLVALKEENFQYAAILLDDRRAKTPGASCKACSALAREAITDLRKRLAEIGNVVAAERGLRAAAERELRAEGFRPLDEFVRSLYKVQGRPRLTRPSQGGSALYVRWATDKWAMCHERRESPGWWKVTQASWLKLEVDEWYCMGVEEEDVPW